jgi:hypothetical protein
MKTPPAGSRVTLERIVSLVSNSAQAAGFSRRQLMGLLAYLEVAKRPEDERFKVSSEEDDAAVAIAAVGPFLHFIAEAVRREKARALAVGPAPDAACLAAAHGLFALFLPEFWKALADLSIVAKADPGEWVRTTAALWGMESSEWPDAAAARAPGRAQAALARKQLDDVFHVLRGEHRKGRPTGTRKVDHVARKAAVYRKADEIDRRSGGRERAPVMRAREALASSLEPGRELRVSTLKKSGTRATAK